MQYDLGYFDDETCRLEAISKPFGLKESPMCPDKGKMVGMAGFEPATP
jgi:hypothetical protein